ncbi:MAG: hypothetical protein WCF95_00770 [bacterium]
MKIGKLLLATVAITVFMTIVGMLTCGGAFNWVYQLEPINVWKPMTGPPSISFYIAEIFLNMIFVTVFAVFSKGIPGKNKYIKGLVYGLAVFAVGMLPGMFMTYFFQTINPIVIAYWTIWGFTLTPLKGLIASTIYE